MEQHDSSWTRLALLGAGLVAVVFVLMAAGVVSLSDDSSAPALQQADDEGFDAMIDLADAEERFVGEAANDTAGWDVANAGDVNGDGADDLLISAPMNDSSAENAGAVYVVYGPADAGEVNLSDADVKLTGVDEHDFAGWSVSTAGDLNNDSYADVVVGAPGKDVPTADESTTGNNTGAAYVVYGSENLSGEVSLADANITLNGSTEYDNAGRSVANVSSVGEGGNPGIAVGAPDEGDNATGAAYLIANDTLAATANATANGTEATNGNATDLDAVADAKLTGVANGSAAGWSIADAGDVDNDTVSEVVVGAPGYNATENATEPAGAAYVHDANVTGNVSLADANRTFVGASPGDQAGYAVATAGDVNNDSYADVVVGAPSSDAGGNQSGAAYVVFGAENTSSEALNLTDANVTMIGAGTQDQAGWSVAGVSDVSCDGVGDVIVGSPYNDTAGPNAGAAYLVEGDEGLAGTQNLTDANATFVGEARGDLAGWSIADAGDRDNDSYQDVLVGAPYNETSGNDAGAAYVVHSDCAEEPVTERTSTPTETATEAPADTPTPTEQTPVDPDDLMDEEETPTPTETPTSTPTATPTETPTEDPATETPTATPTEEPTTATPTEEPMTETPTEEPTTATPTEEPGTETAAPAEPPGTGAPDDLTQFQGCNAVQIYGVDETDTVVVESSLGDDQFANQDFPVDELGLEGSGDDQYVTVTIDDFDEAGEGWAVTSVLAPYDELNPNVDPNSYECN